MNWHPSKTAPKDGTIFYAAQLVKWVPYKQNHGGRWQVHNGYGWENLDDDEFIWTPYENPTQKEQGE